MNISPLSSYGQNRNSAVSHKASLPIQFWIAEKGCAYARVNDKATVQDFQKKLIDFLKFKPKDLKKILKDTEKIKDVKEREKKQKSLYELVDALVQKLRADLAGLDQDYANNVKVRSFYNRVYGGAKPSYIITGDSVKVFDEKYGQRIGIEKNRLKGLIKAGILQEGETTPELEAATNKYSHGGFDFVNYYPRRVKDPKSGEAQVLHVGFEIERDEAGKFVGYKFTQYRFSPEYGQGSY